MKEKGELKKEIEAVLFAAGRKIGLDELAKLCKADKKEIDDAVKELKQDYERSSSPLLLTEEADGYKLTVREKYLSIVKEVAPHTELNRAMLETLAVIAWKHPALQSEVIKIRTSKAYEDIKNLVEMGFVSKEKHGRSFILKATGKFFEYFDLPSKEAVKEIFKDVKDVEPERQGKLDDLQVYESEKKGEEKEELPKEKLGKLEVFNEPEEEETEGEEEQIEKEEAHEEKEEEQKETEEKEEEDGENDEEEKARKRIHELAGEEEESEEKPEDDENRDEEEKEEKPKKKRLPKELEEFAGIDEDKEEDEK